MRAIFIYEGEVIVKRKAFRKPVLEYCKNNEVTDKLAYWKYTCSPQFRQELQDNEQAIKYVFRNKKTGQLLYGKEPDIESYKYIKGYQDYEPFT